MLRHLLLSCLAIGCASAQSYDDTAADASEVRQLVLVVTPSWNATDGTLRRFENDGEAWHEVGEPIAVVVGRSGLGWGRGLHGDGPPDMTGGPVKREGDGRAPAGLFRLTDTFGYDETAATGLPYIATDSAVECVDDVASAYYNRVLRRDTVAADWASHEEMRRRDGLYRLGVVVDHNATRTPGAGSCIFLHVWRGPGTSTAGCTAMTDDAMTAVAAWLRADAYPTLVQLPAAVYEEVREAWRLP